MLGKEKTENYLKIIYRLQKSEGRARGVDIAGELNVARPTVSVTIKELEKTGYVSTYGDGSAVLTEKGLEIAQAVTERYTFFVDMLHFLGIQGIQAKDDACHLEHSLSEESFKALKIFFQNYMSAVLNAHNFTQEDKK